MTERRAHLWLASGVLGLALGAAAAAWHVVSLAIMAGACALALGVAASRLVGRLRERALPPGSPQRLGVMATLAMGLLGWLLNDSGIVVVALASVYIGPFVLLLAQSDDPSKSFVDPPITPAEEQGIA